MEGTCELLPHTTKTRKTLTVLRPQEERRRGLRFCLRMKACPLGRRGAPETVALSQGELGRKEEEEGTYVLFAHRWRDSWGGGITEREH